ncbi:peroxisomal ATPase PEX1 isoform X2 [Chelonus insularis]|uniref:peroxisomal ATPase PEX1 isoform X2 n=1 Tax=Chelonus insularis TaxID=460826 RepID=UPI0015891D04|nr:peroxisomal ATPase PEX1 isoform X2 [Chelonus insularis]
MIQNIQLTIKYITTKSCFVYLSHHLTNKLPPTVQVVKVTHVDDVNEVFYFSFNRSQSFRDNNSIGISSTFAQLLDFREGIYVNITFVDNLPTLSSIDVIPRSEEDLEIVKLRSNKLQGIILQQINVVTLNQPIVIWLSKNLNVVLYVDKLSPKFKYGKLVEFTEVNVQESIKDDKRSHKVQKSNDLDTVNDKYSLSIVRINPLPTLIEEVICNNYSPTNKIYCDLNIFIHLSKAIKISSGVETCEYFFCKLEKVQNNNEQRRLIMNEQKDWFNNREMIIKVIIIENIKNFDEFCCQQLNTINDNNVFACRNLLRQLDLKLGSKVFFKKITVEKQNVTEIKLIPINNEISQELFDSYIKRFDVYDEILINSNTQIFLSPEVSCEIKLVPETINYSLVKIDKIKTLPLRILPKIFNNSLSSVGQENIKSRIILTNAIKKIINDCKLVFELRLKTCQSSEIIYNKENILICGGTGTGKTILCEIIKQQIQQPPYLFHVETINCKKLKGKKVEIVQKFLISTMSNCAYYQPSLLIFDNIDCITNNDVTHCLNVIATCLNISRLGNQFKTLGGIKFFNFVYHIPILEKKDRLKIIRANLEHKQLDFDTTIDWDFIGDKTEGFIVQDIVDLVEKISYVAWRKSVYNSNEKNEITITNNDFVEVTKNYNPIALHGVSLFTETGYSWDEIGGLKDVKECLVQLLQWPLSYIELFSNAPIKQQTGILLYGMPGTGKTMIAGAVARECGLNFISIKGPELLSKYIGASEEAVRDVFDRAQRAAPCVLFFDEFESLAPRRGHDSTGVTDRIVNQLLTQLDGIERREGVAIVAASSRPDLLDPALLRPGRLNRLLLCPLPQENDRLDILNVLCKKYQLDSEDFDLELLAKMTEGFTGADLCSIFNQSKLDLIDENDAKVEKFGEPFGIIITQRHFLNALESTQPSLTPTEVARFNKIYKKFGQGDNFTEDIINNPKATLA